MEVSQLGMGIVFAHNEITPRDDHEGDIEKQRGQGFHCEQKTWEGARNKGTNLLSTLLCTLISYSNAMEFIMKMLCLLLKICFLLQISSTVLGTQ